MVATALVVIIFEVYFAVPLALVLVILPIRLLNVVVKLHEGSFVLNRFLLPSLQFFLYQLLLGVCLALLLERAAFRATN